MDIAHALSNLCRFNGHCPVFYSVAQHSVRVMRAVPPAFKLQALLHDSAEAYLGDVTSGLKDLLPSYKRLEMAVLGEILIKYGLDPTLSQVVRQADFALLVVESEELSMDIKIDKKAVTKPPIPIEPCNAWGPHESEARFLTAFTEAITIHGLAC